MSDNQQAPGEPTYQLANDLPPLDSDEFGAFLAQWHADHNEAGRQPQNVKLGEWEPVEMREPA